MNFLEFLIRIVFGGRGLVKALVVTFVLWAASMFAGLLVRQNVGHDAGVAVALMVPASIIAAVLIDPAGSRFRSWVFDGLYAAISVAIVVAIGGLLVTLVQVELHLERWVRPAWPWAAGLVAALLLRRISTLLLSRSRKAVGERHALKEV